MSLNQMIFYQAQLNPDAIAVLSPGKNSISFSELRKHLHGTSLELSRMGIQPGDRVALVLPNGPEMATAFLAISANCACAPLNPSYLLENFIFALQDLRIKALVTSEGKGHPSHQAAIKLKIPVIELIPDENFSGKFIFKSNFQTDNSIQEPILSGMDDIALLLHTSGTTSRPKIVPLMPRNICYSVQNTIETYSLSSNDRCLNMMPLFHIHGLVGAVASSLASGGSVICTPGFIAEETPDWLVELEPTWFTAVPTLHQALLEQIHQRPYVANKLNLRFIRSCSSPLSPQLAQEMEEVFKTSVLEAYGMTEATHQIAANPLPPKPHKFGSVGVATGTTRITILNEKGRFLPSEKTGEICIQGANVITGYENNPEANRSSFVKGWLRTGDQGYLDKDGYVFIQSRFKELINRAGEKISPREIEDILIDHPAVKQAVVFAIPHPSLGEDVAAAVVLKQHHEVNMLELRQFAAERLIDFKVPRLIVFVPEIPKGPTGKIQRIGLYHKLQNEVDAVKTEAVRDHSVPRDPVEEKLLSIWQQVLEQKQIGIFDDFLAMGGDSLMAARVIMHIENKFNIHLTLKDIFDIPTIASMAALIKKMQNETSTHD
jgi:acyl-CoA synthetase (AMP-forming)/AMP-acid ligase II/acyl carrier protein